MTLLYFQYLLKIVSETNKSFQEIKDEFIAQWGALGTSWGINRTMAQIHALLMVTPEVMSTDEIMEDLSISRGNAHTNLKELVGWGLIRIVVKKGERKEFFEAEKDVWKMFTIIMSERRRREVDPMVNLLNTYVDNTNNAKGIEVEAFNHQLKELEKFVSFASNMSEKIAKLSYGPAMNLAAKVLK